MHQPRPSKPIVALAGTLLLALAATLQGEEDNPTATVKQLTADAAKIASPLTAEIEEGKARLAAMEKEIQDYSFELLEEYTYLDVKLNNGFTDDDFRLAKD